MNTTTPELPFGAQLIGRTEKSLDAVLQRILTDSGLSEPEYVAMRVCADGGGATRAALEAQLTSVFRKGQDHAAELLDRLIAAGIITASSGIELTDTGRSLHDRIVGDTNEVTTRLWGDLPAEDLQVAGRVLSTVLRRVATERV